MDRSQPCRLRPGGKKERIEEEREIGRRFFNGNAQNEGNVRREEVQAGTSSPRPHSLAMIADWEKKHCAYFRPVVPGYHITVPRAVSLFRSAPTSAMQKRAS